MEETVTSNEKPYQRPRDIASTRIIDYITNTRDIDFSKIKGIIGSLYPRRSVKGSLFQYILNSVIEDNVLPIIADDQEQLKKLRRARSVYDDNVANMAQLDDLTGLLRRKGFAEVFNDFLKENPDPYILFVDLDRFKYLNDNRGHESGDKVLELISRLLRKTIDSDGIVGRYGGEEFVIAFNAALDPEETLLQVKDKFHTEIAKFGITDDIFKGTFSAGIAKGNPGESSQQYLNEGIRRADIALYQAKETRDAIFYWNDQMEKPK